jgi:hypothetical protein
MKIIYLISLFFLVSCGAPDAPVFEESDSIGQESIEFSERAPEDQESIVPTEVAEDVLDSSASEIEPIIDNSISAAPLNGLDTFPSTDDSFDSGYNNSNFGSSGNPLQTIVDVANDPKGAIGGILGNFIQDSLGTQGQGFSDLINIIADDI